MRFYQFEFVADKEKLRAKAKENGIHLYDENIFYLFNSYMRENLKKGVSLSVFNWEEGIAQAVFSVDEGIISFEDGFEDILNIMKETFSLKSIKIMPVEITIGKFAEAFREGVRHGFQRHAYYKVDDWIDWRFIQINHDEKYGFEYEEQMLSSKAPEQHSLYDDRFICEIDTLQKQNKSTSSGVNTVHYCMAVRSKEALVDMAMMLGYHLHEAGRIDSRRVGFIRDIRPDNLHQNIHFEETLRHSFGGMVVIELSERFGNQAFDYPSTSKYIEKMFEKYHKKVLFVFAYYLDKPGFAYQLLPEVRKRGLFIPLREGTGTREQTEKFLKSCFRKSELSCYIGQTKEFMERYRAERFSHSDALNMAKEFENWCINKNVLKSYDISMEDDLMLDQEEESISSYERLQKLIGLEKVKKQIDNIISAHLVEKERRKYRADFAKSPCMHMIFAGNPGTAKTTVAKLFAKIMKEKGLLKSGVFVEMGGMDLSCEGVRDAFLSAKGGVLFIDEAYSIGSSLTISTLIQELENHRDEVVVVFAGYSSAMKCFLTLNEGLESRIPYWVNFPDYTTDELVSIFNLILAEKGFSAPKSAIREVTNILDKEKNTPFFGNGRYVRNLAEKAMEKQAARLLSGSRSPEELREEELFLLTKEDILATLDVPKEKKGKMSPKEELDAMIGLQGAKEILHKAVSYYKMNQFLAKKKMPREKAAMHMCFTGNPGSAKTTVARLFAGMLKDEKVLSTGNFVEVGRADLVGMFVGWTAPTVKARFEEAKGGVLFIDEAYSLCDDRRGSFGDEAINTIVQEMENHRDDVIVIFAGYPQPMMRFLSRNPGLKSRIAFHVTFDDYNADELCEIAKLMAKKKDMTFTDAAIKKLKKSFESVQGETDYGNGRFVRNLLEEAEMNLAQRLEGMKKREITKKLLSTIEESDIPVYQQNREEKHSPKKRMGFL